MNVYLNVFNSAVSGEGYFGMNETGNLCALNQKYIEKKLV
jgi:hypothetical protein